MKIGIRNGSLGMGWEEAFAAAGELGFDGVELDVPRDYGELPLFDAAGREKLTALAEKAELGSVCIGALWGVSPASPDEKVRAEAEDVLRRTIDGCNELGAGVILAPITGVEGEEREAMRSRWVETLKRVAPLAEEKQVAVCIENCGGKFRTTAPDQASIVDAVGNDWVKAYFDMANSRAFDADPAEGIRLLGKNLGAVHVKDTGGNMLGKGEVDFASVRAALNDVGYDGWLILETPGGEDPKESARLNLEFTRKAFL